jgi:hypothetical protein
MSQALRLNHANLLESHSSSQACILPFSCRRVAAQIVLQAGTTVSTSPKSGNQNDTKKETLSNKKYLTLDTCFYSGTALSEVVLGTMHPF